MGDICDMVHTKVMVFIGLLTHILGMGYKRSMVHTRNLDCTSS